MDLIFMNSAKEDVGVMQSYELDMAFGEDENNLQCKVPAQYHCCQAGWGLYVEGTEYGGIIDSIESDTVNDEVIYTGRTWHGLLGSRIILPLQTGESSTDRVEVKTTNTAGESLIDRYLTISGDANACIQYIIDRVGLSDLFTTPDVDCGQEIKSYQFNRYTDAYTGLCKMLESAGLKMQMQYSGGMVTVGAVKLFNFAADDEFDSHNLSFKVKKNYKTVNHLICLGKGELEERTVVHLYADWYGNISTTQTIFGLDEYVDIYDFSAVESEEELIKGGKERLKELWTQDEISIDFDDEAVAYDVGDIVGAVENVTGITVSAPIVKKIVTMKDGKITIDLITGEGTGIMVEYSGTYRLHINDDGHLICTYSGSIPPPLRINENGHLVYTYYADAPALHINKDGHLIMTE